MKTTHKAANNRVMNIDLMPAHLQTVRDLLAAHLPETEVWAYGSRVAFTTRRASDLDLVAFASKEQREGIFHLQNALEESNFPFSVDVLVWDEIPKKFQPNIKQAYFIIQEKGEDENLPPGWQKATLGDVADITMGQSPESKFYNLEGEGAPFLQGSAEFGALFPRHKKSTSSWSRQAKVGDILMSVRAPVGDLNIANLEYAIGRGLAAISGREENARFIYYLLKNSAQQINNRASGTVFSSINKALLEGLTFPIPPLAEQKAIAHILGALDSKIELNRQMSGTLEETAKAVFNSWFVDFAPVRAKMVVKNSRASGGWTVKRARAYLVGLSAEIREVFPDKLVNSEMGKIPCGWEVKQIKEICERVARGPFGSNIKVETFVDKGVPIISGTHMHNFLITEGDYQFITEEHAATLRNSIARAGDVVFTCAGTIGQVSLIPSMTDFPEYMISSRQLFARPKNKKLSAYIACFFHAPIGKHSWLSNVSTSGVPSIAGAATHLRGIQITVPEEGAINAFYSIIAPIIDRTVCLARENNSLAALRNTLLPKLVSGELRVRDAEKFIRKAGV